MQENVLQEVGDRDNGTHLAARYHPADQNTEALNGHVSQKEPTRNGNGSQDHLRRGTSSPSGRSGSVRSGASDSSRRRVESDTVKEPSARNSVSKSRRRTRDSASPGKHRGRSRTPSPSPKRRKRDHSDEKSRSRSRSKSRHSDRRRSGSRSRHNDRQGKNGGRRDDDRSHRRSRSRSPRRRNSRDHNGGNRGNYGRQSDRDHPKPSRCVGIFGLSTRTRERDVRAVFEKYGPLDNVQLIHDHQSGRSRGFGFVYFSYINDAEDAKNDANGMLLDDRRIRVDFSLTQRSHAAGVRRSADRGERSQRRSRSRSRSGSREQRRRSRSRSVH